MHPKRNQILFLMQVFGLELKEVSNKGKCKVYQPPLTLDQVKQKLK